MADKSRFVLLSVGMFLDRIYRIYRMAIGLRPIQGIARAKRENPVDPVDPV